MTDVFGNSDAAAAPAASPMSEPAPMVQTPAATPERTSFDDQLDDFLSRDLMAEMTEPTVTSPVAPAPSAEAAQPAAPGVAPATPASATPSPVSANGGTPPATTSQAAPAGETAPTEVDANLLLQMFSTPGETPPAPAAPAAPTSTAPAPAAADDDTPPMPFTTQMQLPPQLVSAIFESEDPVQRTQALTGLMASLGNAVVAVVESRIKEHHAPRMAQQFEVAQQARQTAAAVGTHFYGAYPELADYKQIVTKAGQVYLGANPDATYDEKTAAGIAALARQALQQMGKTLTPAAAASAPASAPAPARQPATPYVAGNASPGGNLEVPLDPNDPKGVLDQMLSGWG